MYGSGAMPSHDVPCLVATCATTCVLAVLAILALGSNTRPGVVPRCSAAFWAILAACVPATLSVMLLGVWLSRVRARVTTSYPKLSSEATVPFLTDMDIDEVSSDSTSVNFSKAKAQAENTLQPWAMCSFGLFIGIISGLVGVGGGEFLVPMFLSVGFQHQKSSATSSCLIALATACDAINYFRSRELQPFVLYVPWLYVLPLFGALLGKLQISKYLSTPSRRVWLLASLFAAISICCVLACVQAVASSQKEQGSVFAVQTSQFC